jgi:hypothetical protein
MRNDNSGSGNDGKLRRGRTPFGTLAVFSNRFVLRDLNLIEVAPHPTLSRFYRLYDGVLGGVKMLGRMLVFRGIAASHVTAFAAKPQVHPGIARFQAFFATVSVWPDVPYMVQMRTAWIHDVASCSCLGWLLE